MIRPDERQRQRLANMRRAKARKRLASNQSELDEEMRWRKGMPFGKAKPMTTRCKHRPEPKLDYMPAWADSIERMMAGQKQRKCPHCRRYVWEEFWAKRRKKA